MKLGDMVETALARVGLTDARVTTWLGRPCGCEERRDKLNALDSWARHVLRSSVTGPANRAMEYLARLMGGDR